jgi:inosose dehydratase
MHPPILPRRRFIRSVSHSLALAALAPAAFAADKTAAKPKPARPLVGSNIYVWTQYAQRDKQPLDLPGVISALSDAGYDYLENFMNVAQPEENARFADQLKGKGMQPVSLYVGAALHEADKAGHNVTAIAKAAEVCAKAGFQVLSCNPNPIGREKTLAELATQAAALTDLGTALNDLGMRLGVHHHLPEMASNAREFHYTFQHTPTGVVDWCYDVHWVWKGGIAPLTALAEYGERVVTWHLRQSRGGVWWEDLDTGDIDYQQVAAYGRKHRLPQRFTVELALEKGTAITRSGAENHRRSRKFIKKVFKA